MKNYHLLIHNDLLRLKPDRAAAYGISPVVRFFKFQLKQGYKVPWLVCADANNQLGHYKPSDFTGKA